MDLKKRRDRRGFSGLLMRVYRFGMTDFEIPEAQCGHLSPEKRAA
jgi:hypothetical protein|tara:strand:- start:6343 stop:6477 length:135 start_codon:yes stop_codon:yes gene_type:complete